MSCPNINRAACKRFLLECAASSRPHHKWTRVAEQVFETLDFKLREMMRQVVQSQPSKGKTIK